MKLALGDADAVDDHEVRLGLCVSGDGLEIVGVDGTDAATLHLLEVHAALDGAHEQDDLDRLDVGSGGDHVDGDDDARVEAVAEGLNEVLGLGAGGLVGDLLAELVPLAKLLANDLDDVLGVGVVLGEDEGLRYVGSAGEDLGGDLVTEGADDGADLIGGDAASIEFVGSVLDVLVGTLPADFAGLSVAQTDHGGVLGFDDAAPLGDLRADAVDLEIDVDVVGDGFLVAVFHHQVLLKEAERVLGRGGGEADEVGVEVVEHLSPQRVDGAVAFVDDDDVEVLGRDRGIVDDGQWLLGQRGDFPVQGFFFQLGVEFRFALEHRVEALDGGDDHF